MDNKKIIKERNEFTEDDLEICPVCKQKSLIINSKSIPDSIFSECVNLNCPLFAIPLTKERMDYINSHNNYSDLISDFSGSISDVKISDKYMSREEVKENFYNKSDL